MDDISFMLDKTALDRPRTLAMDDVWREPRCLVSFSADGKLAVNDDTLKALDCISVPLVVVSVVGPYRTGKSYLMNRLAATKKGFSVGSTVQGHTKGIWIWCRPHPKRSNCCLVLMDSEGLVDCERANKTDDTYIFSLTLLLSSTLVYNCKHALDKTALDSLHFVTVAADHIKVKSNSDGSGDDEESGIGLEKYFPVFAVAVRDFTLELEWEGQPVTEDEYLECILKLKKGNSRAVSDYNMPRQCIRAYFPTRKCFMFPSPVRDDEQLKHLEDVADSQLNEMFRVKRDKFIDFIYANSEPKKVDVNTLNGRSFAGLARCYVEAIEKGSICVESAVETMARAENEKVAAEALAIYQTEFRRLIQFPTETVDEMSKAHDVCQKQATEHFLKHCICDYDNKYKQRFLSKLRDTYNAMYSQNARASADRCTELLDELHRPVVNKDYACSGGYRTYQEDMIRLRTQYNQQPGKGIMAHEKWNEFMTRQAHVASQILNADESLEAAEKTREDQRRNQEDNERMMMAAREAERKMEQILIDQERNFQQQMEQMRDQMDREKQEREREFLEAQEARKREQDQLVKEGLDENAKLQREALKMMKEEQERSAKEAEENRKMFEKLMKQSNEERKQELEAMRQELKRSMEHNASISDKLQQMENRHQDDGPSNNPFVSLAVGIIDRVATAFVGKIFKH